MKNSNIHIRNLVYSSLCLALCLVLPFLTGQIQTLGRFLSPMHLPVLLCGIICSWYWGAAVGAVAPILRFALFGMPVFIKAIPMAFELAAYGAAAGLIMLLLRKKLPYLCNIYIALIGAMLIGRFVWAFAMLGCFYIGFINSKLTFDVFIASEFIGMWPGMLIQLLIIPPVVLAMRRAHLISSK